MLQEYVALAKKEKMVKISAAEMSGEQQTLLYGCLTGFDLAVAGHIATIGHAQRKVYQNGTLRSPRNKPLR